MALLFTRQPIYDQNKKLYGYDLLYQIEARENEREDSPPAESSGSRSDVMVAGFMGVDIQQLASSRRVFLTFSERMLLHDMATFFPREKVVVQIKPDVQPKPEVLAACESIRRAGYMIAVDESFVRRSCDELVELADFIKVDFPGMSEDDHGLHFNRWMNGRRRWLARGIDSEDTFDKARQYPFSLYQGSFVSQPVVRSENKIPTHHVNHLRLINAIEAENPKFEEIAGIIESDPHLSYEILRMTNSVYYYRGQKVRSIRQAAVLMGINELRKWAMVTTLRRFSGGRDDQGLVQHCAQRARILEQLSQKMGIKAKVHEYFTLGLLSMIDVLTQCPMELVLTELAITDDMKDILLGRADQGEMAECFSLLLAYEMGNWTKTEDLSDKLSLSSETVRDAYYDSILWANDFDRD